MSVEIKAIEHTRKGLKPFVKFGIDLYKGNGCYVPPLVLDEIETLSPSGNPAFEFCRAQAFMAYRDGKPVGRIAAIINEVVNNRTGRDECRFGFVDFIDDAEVSDALFAAAEGWARENGMTEMVGPLGFSDMDHEGMLVEGFDEMGTMATIYNYPYYPAHLERMGYAKDADWIEFRVEVPDEVPAKIARVADMVARRYNLHVKHYTSRKKIKEEYGVKLFELINDAYDHLYGYSPLSRRQIEYYIDKYLGILRLDCVSVILDNNDRLVAVGISIPSMSKALRKSGGRLLPFGWFHLLKGIKGRNDVVDLMLIAVDKEYMGKGVNSLIFADLVPTYVKLGFKFAESNIELETNDNVQLQWQYFNYRQHRRRRAYRKSLV